MPLPTLRPSVANMLYRRLIRKISQVAMGFGSFGIWGYGDDADDDNIFTLSKFLAEEGPNKQTGQFKGGWLRHFPPPAVFEREDLVFLPHSEYPRLLTDVDREALVLLFLKQNRQWSQPQSQLISKKAGVSSSKVRQTLQREQHSA